MCACVHVLLLHIVDSHELPTTHAYSYIVADNKRTSKLKQQSMNYVVCSSGGRSLEWEEPTQSSEAMQWPMEPSPYHKMAGGGGGGRGRGHR